MRARVFVVILALFALAFAAFGLASTASAAATAQKADSEVKIDNFTFGPGTMTVQTGATITWTNHDDIPHTVMSTDGVFRSRALDTDEKFSYTFSKAGVYQYYCSIHPKMTGQVVVK